MVIVIFGESCTGKSTLADALKAELNAAVYSGKDYLRFAKSETEAKAAFCDLLKTAQENVIWVVSEKEMLDMAPENSFRILVTADIALIRERFAKRMNGRLPPPVAAMLEKKHGMFDGVPHDCQIVSGEKEPGEACAAVLALLGGRGA